MTTLTLEETKTRPLSPLCISTSPLIFVVIPFNGEESGSGASKNDERLSGVIGHGGV